MKKIFLTIIFGLFASQFLYSQYVENNVMMTPYITNSFLISSNNYGGTARFVGMSGAFGALGGDFSSITINPAGVGIYRSSEFTITPGMSVSNNSSNYINNTLEDDNYSMNLNNLGIVISYNLENSDTRWINANFGIGFNRINNFNSNMIFEGVNNSSLIEPFVANANYQTDPTNPENLDGMYEYLFWDTYLLDSAGTNFYSNVDDAAWTYNTTSGNWERNPNFDINQRKIKKTEGGVNEFNFAFGGNYANTFYIGASIGISWLNLTEYSSHHENELVETAIYDFHSFDFIEHSTTSGTGYNLKLGAIYKPFEFLRIGASLHTPTFYNLDQQFYNKLTAYYDNGDVYDATSQTQKYSYTLHTPLKLEGSIAYQIGKFGLIDVDYEYVNYSSMKLGDDSNSDGVIEDNSTIDKLYQATHNVRAGGEIRVGSLYFRAGGSYSTSPYVSSSYNSDYSKFSFSGGLGYRVKNLFVDFAFSQTRTDYKLSAYQWNYNTALASINNKMNNFILTVGLKF